MSERDQADPPPLRTGLRPPRRAGVVVSAITCDRCGGGHGPWDSYAEGRILLCCECRENVPDAVRYAPSATEQKRSSLAGETP